MKNLVLFSMFAILMLCMACSDEMLNENKPQKGIDPSGPSLVEEAFSNVQKQLVTLSNGMQVACLDSFYILGGDMILSKEQIDAFNRPQTKSAIVHARSWPNKIVFYQVEGDAYFKQLVLNAIAHWEANSNLRFWEKFDGITNYISIFQGSGSYSYVGMVGGKQDLCLDYFAVVGTAIHEIGHAVGLFHEQCRVDRDNYITVNYNNILEEYKINFRKYSELGYQGSDVGTFDFNSIMIYSSFTGYEINSNIPSITRKDGSTFVAQRIGLSTGDIASINTTYSAPAPVDAYYNKRTWEERPGGWGDYYKYEEYTFFTRYPVQKDEMIYITVYEEADGSGQEYYPPYEHVEQVKISKGMRTAKFTLQVESSRGTSSDWYRETKQVTNIRYSFTSLSN